MHLPGGLSTALPRGFTGMVPVATGATLGGTPQRGEIHGLVLARRRAAADRGNSCGWSFRHKIQAMLCQDKGPDKRQQPTLPHDDSHASIAVMALPTTSGSATRPGRRRPAVAPWHLSADSPVRRPVSTRGGRIKAIGGPVIRVAHHATEGRGPLWPWESLVEPTRPLDLRRVDQSRRSHRTSCRPNDGS